MKIYDDIDLLHHVAGADLFHVPFWLMMPHGSCVLHGLNCNQSCMDIYGCL